MCRTVACWYSRSDAPGGQARLQALSNIRERYRSARPTRPSQLVQYDRRPAAAVCRTTFPTAAVARRAARLEAQKIHCETGCPASVWEGEEHSDDRRPSLEQLALAACAMAARGARLGVRNQALPARSEEFTAADIQMSFPLEAASARVGLDASRPRLAAFLDRVHARPAYQRALERGGEFTLLS
jgi:glutathione S-transferase